MPATARAAGSPTGPGDDRRTRVLAALYGIQFTENTVSLDPAVIAEFGGPDADAATSASSQADEAELRRDRVDAVRLRTRAALLDPAPAGRLERLGLTLLRAGAFGRESAAIFRGALGLDPSLVQARYRLGLCCQQAGELTQARAEWGELVRQRPEHGQGHARLAVVEFFLENDAAAWAHVHAAERLGTPVPAHFLVNLAERTPEPP